MTLAEGTPKRVLRLRLLRAQAPDRALSLHRGEIRPAERRRSPSCRREAHGRQSRHRGDCRDHCRQAQGHSRRLLRAASRQERQPDRLADRRASPGTIALKPIEGFDITDAAALPDGGIVILERRFRYSEGIKMRIRRVSAAELKPGAVIKGEVLLEATDSLNIDNMEAIGVHRRRLRRDHHHAHVGRQFQPAAADSDHAVHAARREVGRRCA